MSEEIQNPAESDDSVTFPTPEASPVEAATNPAPLTTERVVDIALGVIAVAAEASIRTVQHLGDQARGLQENGPAMLDSLEERGRPLRARIAARLRDGFAPIADDVPEADPASPPRTADQEISALEQRVRELETQVSVEPDAASGVSAPAAADETPADGATFVPSGNHPFTLADSAYAVSETDEESERERDAASGEPETQD
jgi:hypothetical protein